MFRVGMNGLGTLACPTPMLVRLACLPILVVLPMALLIVHPQWSVAEGQFGWLLLILFTSILIAGPGPLALNHRFAGALRYD